MKKKGGALEKSEISSRGILCGLAALREDFFRTIKEPAPRRLYQESKIKSQKGMRQTSRAKTPRRQEEGPGLSMRMKPLPVQSLACLAALRKDLFRTIKDLAPRRKAAKSKPAETL